MHPKLFPISCIFIAIATLIHLPASLAQGNEFYQNCSQLFQCGNIQGIGYPFWGANRPQACGHPSFSLNCTGEAPVLTIETQPYRVLAIDDTTYALKVVREEYWDNSCPQFLYNATLDETPFNYTSDTDDLVLSYGCTTSLTGTTIPGQFSCLANGTSGTFGIYSSNSATATLANIPTGVTCTTSVIVTVNSTEGQALASSVENVTQVLNSGVGLLWQANNSYCERCVASRGRCGSDSSNAGSFICYCPDRDYAFACGSSSGSGGSGTCPFDQISSVFLLCSFVRLCFFRKVKESCRGSSLDLHVGF
ncbi:hypothetical protein Vadar_028090 [Vaccinium darrowii]|uniref:Uncharacterized protein n=1 Tax=Vaccinium darrowii TaxID=229202 RepID=A0ACB7XUJ1_9ERIC|nr:hypothetical protein Vadar_028090 [Vaccinium darrowii]